MAVLFRRKMLWLATPRTASTATRNAFLAAGGERIDPHHIGIEQIRGRRREPVVTTIRNPYDILASWWIVRTMGDLNPRPFANFILGFNDAKGNFQRKGKLLYHATSADIVVRYENLEADLDAALKQCGLEPVTLEQVNVTKGKADWKRYYSPDAIVAANRRFGAEIEQHGYELLG